MSSYERISGAATGERRIRSRGFARRAGLASAVAGAAFIPWILAQVVVPEALTVGTAEYWTYFGSLAVLSLGLLAGLLAHYAVYGDGYGLLGKVGAALVGVTLVASPVVLAVDLALGTESTLPVSLVGTIVGVLAMAMMGVALLRSRIGSRLTGWLFALAPVSYLVSIGLASFVFEPTGTGALPGLLPFALAFGLAWVLLGNDLRNAAAETGRVEAPSAA